jgi:hypothetical protein
LQHNRPVREGDGRWNEQLRKWTQADAFLTLAQEHAAAGNLPITHKLTDVACGLKTDIAKLRAEL